MEKMKVGTNGGGGMFADKDGGIHKSVHTETGAPSATVANLSSIGLPAAEFVIVIKTFIPTNEELHHASFLEYMKALSSTIQNSIGCLQPHNKKEFFAMMIQVLEAECRGEYLVDDQAPTTSIFDKIKKFSENIIKIIRDKSGSAFHHRHMVPGMNLRQSIDHSPDEWSILFRKKSRKLSTYKRYSFLFDNSRLTVLHFISQYGDIRNPKRYSRGELFNAELFELAQIMLWSRISNQSYDQLLNFFTKSSISSVRQHTANDPEGTLMNQWISGLVDTVGTTVYYLYKLYVNHVGKKQPGDGSHSEMVLMGLIEGVLKGTTEFFSKYGLDPAELPEWFTQKIKCNNGDKRGLVKMIINGWLLGRNMMDGRHDDVKTAELKTKIHEKLMDSTSEIWVNFLSFIRVSFALNLHSHVLIKTGGRPRVATFEDLGVGVGVIRSPSDMCVLKGSDKGGKPWTACISDYASNFERFELEIQGKLLDELVRTYLDSKHIQLREPKKKNKGTEVTVEPRKPSRGEYASMKAVIVQFKTPTVTGYLRDKLQACCDDPVTTAKLNKLLTSINEYNPSLLDRCYVEEVDQDDERGSSEEEEENGVDLCDDDEEEEEEEESEGG